MCDLHIIYIFRLTGPLASFSSASKCGQLHLKWPQADLFQAAIQLDRVHWGMQDCCNKLRPIIFPPVAVFHGKEPVSRSRAQPTCHLIQAKTCSKNHFSVSDPSLAVFPYRDPTVNSNFVLNPAACARLPPWRPPLSRAAMKPSAELKRVSEAKGKRGDGGGVSEQMCVAASRAWPCTVQMCPLLSWGLLSLF